MPELLAALDAFVQEHRRCGDLDSGVDGEGCRLRILVAPVASKWHESELTTARAGPSPGLARGGRA